MESYRAPEINPCINNDALAIQLAKRTDLLAVDFVALEKERLAKLLVDRSKRRRDAKALKATGAGAVSASSSKDSSNSVGAERAMQALEDAASGKKPLSVSVLFGRAVANTYACSAKLAEVQLERSGIYLTSRASISTGAATM